MPGSSRGSGTSVSGRCICRYQRSAVSPASPTNASSEVICSGTIDGQPSGLPRLPLGVDLRAPRELPRQQRPADAPVPVVGAHPPLEVDGEGVRGSCASAITVA